MFSSPAISNKPRAMFMAVCAGALVDIQPGVHLTGFLAADSQARRYPSSLKR